MDTKTAEVMTAIQAGDKNKLSALLAANPALASARDAAGVSAIMQAVYHRRAELLTLLLAGQPALDIFEASSLGRTDRVSELLRQDPQLVSAWSPDGFTALHLAAFFGQEAVAKLLLQHGADVQLAARNPMQVAPLHAAAAGHNLPLVRILLEHGAQPNARQQKGYTPLHSAAQNGDKVMVELLLANGADRTLANDDGKTPAQTAKDAGHPEVAAML
jgi:ankyrin repeat protein